MSEKKRIYRLRCRIKKILEREGYDVFSPTEDAIFHLVAVRPDEARLIHVCLEFPDEQTLALLRKCRRKARKEIWFREKRGALGFIRL